MKNYNNLQYATELQNVEHAITWLTSQESPDAIKWIKESILKDLCEYRAALQKHKDTRDQSIKAQIEDKHKEIYLLMQEMVG